MTASIATIPASIQALMAQGNIFGLDAFTEGLGGPAMPPTISVKGTRFVIKEQGLDDQVLNQLELTGVLVGAKPTLDRAWYAAKFVDVEVETMTSSMMKLTKSMDGARGGAETQIKAFRFLNVQYQNTDGTLRNAKEVWTDTIDALGKVSNEAERDAIALELFGKSAQELNPLIKAGSAELKRLGEEAQKSGAIISDENVASLGALDDELQRMKAQLEAAGSELAVSFAPVLKELAPLVKDVIVPAIQSLADILKDLLEEYNSLSPATQKWVIGLGVGALAIGPVATGVGKTATGLGKLVGWLGKAAKPVAGIGGAAAAATGSVGALGAALSFLAAPLIAIGAGLAAIMIAKHYVDKEIASMEAQTAAGVASVTAAAERAKTKIAEQHQVKMDAINGEMAAEEAAYLQSTQNIQDEYEAQVKASGKTEQVLKKALAKRQSDLDKAHNDAIQAIQDEYGVFESKQKSRTDIVQEEADAQKGIVQEVLDLSRDIATQEGAAFSKTYDAILKKASAMHDEKMRMYTEEYLKSVKLINLDLKAKVSGFQSEIDKLEAATKEEEQIEQNQANKQKILDLTAARDRATNMRDRREAERDLAEEINRQAQEKERINRQIQIDSLNQQIQTAIAKAEEDKQNAIEILNEKTGAQQVIIDSATQHTIDQIQAERLAKEAAENAKYNAAKASLDAEEEAMDGFGDSYKASLETELAQKQQLESDKLAATKERLRLELEAEKKKIADEQKIYDDIIANLNNSLAGSTTHQSDSGSTFGGGGRSFIPGFATGISNFSGGLARVNENGGEIRYLPNGTSVIPHDLSAQLVQAAGSAMGSSDAAIQSLLRQLAESDRNVNVVVKVGEREVQDIVIDAIRSRERQTGRPF